MDNGKIYNLVLQHYNHRLKEALKTPNKWRNTNEDQDLVETLTMIRDSTYGLKKKTIWDNGDSGVQVRARHDNASARGHN